MGVWVECKKTHGLLDVFYQVIATVAEVFTSIPAAETLSWYNYWLDVYRQQMCNTTQYYYTKQYIISLVELQVHYWWGFIREEVAS